MSVKGPILLREANSEDIKFIFNSWLRSYKSSIVNKRINPDSFYFEHHKIIEKILKRGKVVVACEESDHSSILGYAAGEKTEGVFILHYVYVKHPFRKLRIADATVSKLGELLGHSFELAGFYTHFCGPYETGATIRNLYYNPYLQYDRNWYTPEVAEEKPKRNKHSDTHGPGPAADTNEEPSK